jgi:3-oxoacyl-[acyl-carrier protein] reductase
MQLSSLEGKVAIVSGASRGIGQSIACVLGAMGATVIGTATSEASAEKISAYLEEKGLKGFGVVLNVNDADAVIETVKKITTDVGAPQILVNNAGVTRDNLLLRMKEEEWAETIQTNLTGVYRLTKACLRGMMKAKWGRIISISSVVGVTGNPGQTNYAATKAGVIAFSKSLAKEVGSRGITANVVAPGFIQTDMTNALSAEQRERLLESIPLGRMGEAVEIANSVGFLASEEARYITGETIHVNGGMLMD